MKLKTVFKRYELKYIITEEQQKIILKAAEGKLFLDKYGKTLIKNLYFDTPDYLLIRRSIEKPCYKEKLRLRSYGQVSPSTPVFAELKKKYNSVVYKRRISLPYETALNWLTGNEGLNCHTQISREIDYFLKYYKTLEPKVFLSYEREAYYWNEDKNFRVTFDKNITVRDSLLSLEKEVFGHAVLPEDKILMEIKCTGGIPLWLTAVLSEEKIYKTSFSKYGTAYKQLIFPKINIPAPRKEFYND